MDGLIFSDFLDGLIFYDFLDSLIFSGSLALWLLSHHLGHLQPLNWLLEAGMAQLQGEFVFLVEFLFAL